MIWVKSVIILTKRMAVEIVALSSSSHLLVTVDTCEDFSIRYLRACTAYEVDYETRETRIDDVYNFIVFRTRTIFGTKLFVIKVKVLERNILNM